MLSPKGRVVLISGANRGLGRAIAENLYNSGYTLSLGARDPRSLDDLCTGWDASRVLANRYDAKNRETHSRWVEATIERFGHIDGLINNAGVAIEIDLEGDEDDSRLDLIWAVNVKGPLSMVRKTLPHLRKSGSGRIINLASIAGKAVFGTGVGYSMSKYSLVALSHACRHAGWKDGVRCTALCPGYVDTDMTTSVTTIAREKMISPEDIGDLVATLIGLSNNASVAELIVNCRDDVSM